MYVLYDAGPTPPPPVLPSKLVKYTKKEGLRGFTIVCGLNRSVAAMILLGVSKSAVFSETILYGQ